MDIIWEAAFLTLLPQLGSVLFGLVTDTFKYVDSWYSVRNKCSTKSSIIPLLQLVTNFIFILFRLTS